MYKENNEIKGFIGILDKKIEMLFISPKYFLQGVGKKLINFALQHCSSTLVDVNEQNKNALLFYEKSGFKVFGRDERDGFGKNYPILHLKLHK